MQGLSNLREYSDYKILFVDAKITLKMKLYIDTRNCLYKKNNYF